jgi:hypothetical protein
MKRIALLICLVSVLSFWTNNRIHAQANSGAHQIYYTSLPIPDILDSIGRIFYLNFSYNADLPVFKKHKSVTIDSNVDEVLTNLFKDEEIGYSIVDRQVILFTKEEKPEAFQAEKQPEFYVVRGKVTDRSNNDPLSYASVSLLGKSLGTVANASGEFIIKLPSPYIHDTIAFSCMGYSSGFVAADSLISKDVTIKLNPSIIQIKSVVIKLVPALDIIKEVLLKRKKNYSEKGGMYTAFYRETTQENKDYISIYEAVLDISKAPYSKELLNDQAKVFKERRGEDVKKLSTLSYKLEGGVYNCVRMDVMKDVASFLSPDYYDEYTYSYVKNIEYDNRVIQVVEFDQKDEVELALFKGTMYIDQETKALVAVKFKLSPKGMKYAKRLLVIKSPRKFQIKPLDTDYQVYYKYYNGKWYLAYIKAEINIKAKSTRTIFNSVFKSVSEMVITGIDTTNTRRFHHDEIAKVQDVMADRVINTDKDFWSNYNVIQPDKSLIEAVNKLNIKKNFTTDLKVWENYFK